MTDIEALGLEIQDYSKYRSNKNDNEEMIHRIESINKYHDNNQKYGTGNPIRTDKDYIGYLDKMYIVKSHYGQLSSMGYGYCHTTYIIANNIDDVTKYCEKRFGKQYSDFYYNLQYFNFVINKANSKLYLKEVNEILNKIKRYNDIKCINNNFLKIKMKLVVSEGIPIMSKNGVIEYEGRGEIERYYEPEQLDEIYLV